MLVSTLRCAPESDNPNEAEGAKERLPGGQRAFQCPSPSRERWGSEPRSSIPGLAHTVFPQIPMAPSPASGALSGRRGHPRPAAADPAPTRPGNPLSPTPSLRSSSGGSGGSSTPSYTHHHPLPSSRRKSLCFLCSHRPPELGRPGLFGWGSFFVYTVCGCVCVCAGECVYVQNGHRILPPRLPQVRAAWTLYLVAPGSPALCAGSRAARGPFSNSHPRPGPQFRAPDGPSASSPCGAAGQPRRCQRAPGTRTPASGGRGENLLKRRKSAERTGRPLPPPSPSRPHARARGKPPSCSRPERVPQDAPSPGHSPALRSPARPPTRSVGARPPCRAC